ncbi:hypothetical protein TRVL_08698 [Trypanosoma vivax]|nr:hypothetical protein TRVL_08698 [Trypanosoma vivax]
MLHPRVRIGICAPLNRNRIFIFWSQYKAPFCVAEALRCPACRLCYVDYRSFNSQSVPTCPWRACLCLCKTGAQWEQRHSLCYLFIGYYYCYCAISFSNAWKSVLHRSSSLHSPLRFEDAKASWRRRLWFNAQSFC